MAAFLHDELYRRSALPKEQCDDIFLEAMDCLRVGEMDRWRLYEGVHLLGWSSFEGDRKAE